MSQRGVEYLQGSQKRRLDIVGAIAIGTLGLPIGFAAATCSAIDTGKLNPLFVQRRFGREGKPFDAIKFRTIKEDRETADLTILGTFDPRASKIGLFLRKYGLDEYPQIVNVVKGDMSLVGFRPSTTAALEDYEHADPVLFDEWYECFKLSRPGLTSTSSIYRHGILHTTPEVRRQSMRLDISDTENASLRNDLRILARVPLDLIHANTHIIDNSSSSIND